MKTVTPRSDFVFSAIVIRVYNRKPQHVGPSVSPAKGRALPYSLGVSPLSLPVRCVEYTTRVVGQHRESNVASRQMNDWLLLVKVPCRGSPSNYRLQADVIGNVLKGRSCGSTAKVWYRLDVWVAITETRFCYTPIDAGAHMPMAILALD